jgi:uncharacterized protein (TIGR03083 family)
MDIALAIETVGTEGERLLEVAVAAGLDAPVPTCPEWKVRELVAHTGGVHRWAGTIVLEGRTNPVGQEEEGEIMRPPAGDEALLSWFGDGHRRLTDALRAAPPDLECWTFMPAPSPLAFWSRRQAHETTMHRVDAESAAGRVTGVAASVAVDGIDELVTRFLVRPRGRLRADPARELAVETTDTADAWDVSIGPDRVCAERRPRAREAQPGATPDCTIRGPASDLYLLLWNRIAVHDAEIEVDGDPELLRLWRQEATVRW